MFNHLRTRLSPHALKMGLAVALAFTIGAGSLAAGLVVNGVVEACYNNTTGALRIATTERPCVTTGANRTQLETPISWNVAGPAGPTGPTGPTGATGPAGPAGAGRLPTTQIFIADITDTPPGSPIVAFFDASPYKRIRVTVGTGQATFPDPECVSDYVDIVQESVTHTSPVSIDRIDLCEARYQSRLYELPGAAMRLQARINSSGIPYNISIVGD